MRSRLNRGCVVIPLSYADPSSAANMRHGDLGRRRAGTWWGVGTVAVAVMAAQSVWVCMAGGRTRAELGAEEYRPIRAVLFTKAYDNDVEGDHIAGIRDLGRREREDSARAAVATDAAGTAATTATTVAATAAAAAATAMSSRFTDHRQIQSFRLGSQAAAHADGAADAAADSSSPWSSLSPTALTRRLDSTSSEILCNHPLLARVPAEHLDNHLFLLTDSAAYCIATVPKLACSLSYSKERQELRKLTF
ncbi:hypothetical protein GGX14DRAFT_406934 [Mycena pura]|uniref:Uncharacterized protein n=1 Tax=Mycena pura TaxID=153505 RepID=A0AAD6UQS5_9AGAR|nr:hypothetical protein GGX14DRAFT_406934 [Mycena pura]